MIISLTPDYSRVMDPRLKEILDEEKESSRQNFRKKYVEFTSAASLRPNVEEAVIIIGSKPVKKYVAQAISALDTHTAIFLAGKGEYLGKLVSVVELVKLKVSGRVIQHNQASLTDSLINPDIKLESNLSNINAFFSDNSATEQLQIKTEIPNEHGSPELVDAKASNAMRSSVLRLIHGPKVYEIPTMTIILTKKDVQVPKGWSKQVTP